MSKSDIEFLNHIKKECEYLLKSSTNFSEDDFYKDETLQSAFTRSLEIIGEASKRVNLDFKLKYNSVAWSDMARTRDKIIHHYDGVDYELIWDIVKTNIPELQHQLEQIINEHNNK